MTERHKTNSIAMLIALAIVAITILVGLAITTPATPQSEPPCVERLEPKSAIGPACDHSLHKIEDYNASHFMCRCVEADTPRKHDDS